MELLTQKNEGKLAECPRRSQDEINVVIGSWGSYNECNERALGSQWLNLAEFSDWDEIRQELTNQGFELDGLDEELFIQDIEGLPSNCASWDYMSPCSLFTTLQESRVFDEQHKFDTMIAFLEVRCFSDFKELVSERGSNWDDDIYLYPNFDWEDYGREMFDCYGYKIEERLLDFFDFEAYGRYCGDYYCEEYSNGIIEIVV